MSLKKMFKTAPLPFQGQKRRFAGSFATALTQLKEKQEIKVVVDLFGGSGLLSHTAKHIIPEAKVVYNDYDNYSQRLRNVSKTNILLNDIREIGSYKSKNNQKITPEIKAKLLDRIIQEEKSGFVDYITLSSSLMFSVRYITNFEELSKETFYNNIKVSNYDFNPDEYLAGLEVVKYDYKELYTQYKDAPGVLFTIDPPYLFTDTTTYNSDKYWKLRDYLDVLKVLSDTNYFFFTSEKSSLVELCEWIDNNKGFSNPFVNSVLNTQNMTLNITSNYTDMMLYKFIE